ncbi:MAG: PBP1A family penicillin-binding protein [Sphingomonadaceae bacterium]
MGIPFFNSSRRKRGSEREEAGGHAGYFALHDRFEGPDYDEWDARLDAVDRRVDRERRARLRWWQRSYWRERGKLWWTVRVIAGMLALFIVLVGWLAVTAPLSKSLQPIVPPQITLTAADGTPIARNGAITDSPVRIATLPSYVPEAFIAIEDRRFYHHWGIDPKGIARAAFSNLTGGMEQGGSTITQQLAKFTFLTPERSLTRKGREMLIAFWLEAWLTKNQILERYLSNAYFGDNVYGLRAASEHYFSRPPERLTRTQAAMLAGLVQAPSRLNPARHYDRAEARMRLVLKAMAEQGYITKAQSRAPEPKLDLHEQRDLPSGSYFADWAMPQARAQTDSNPYARQTVTTTLDSRLQSIARDVTRSAPLKGAQVALVAMRPNGDVLAMIGGTDYDKTPYNRAVQAMRQPGSTFKLFVYLAALRNGWSPDDTISNEPITTGSYQPKNADAHYSKTITLKQALTVSSNVAAVRLLGKVGDDAVIRTARDLGITTPLAKGDPSLALGTSTMNLLELTAAYAGVAGNQFPVHPHAIAQPDKGFWQRMWNGPKSLPTRTHDEMQEMLRNVVNAGTGRAAALPIANYGKTGTTQDNRDALFVGYAGGLVVGVWVGRDDNTPLGRVSGGTVPARIWHNFMMRALRLQRAAPPPIEVPDSVDPDLGPPSDGESGQVIDLGDGTHVRVDGSGATLSLPGGEIRLDRDTLGVDGKNLKQLRDQIDAARQKIERQVQQSADQPAGKPSN